MYFSIFSSAPAKRVNRWQASFGGGFFLVARGIACAFLAASSRSLPNSATQGGACCCGGGPKPPIPPGAPPNGSPPGCRGGGEANGSGPACCGGGEPKGSLCCADAVPAASGTR